MAILLGLLHSGATSVLSEPGVGMKAMRHSCDREHESVVHAELAPFALCHRVQVCVLTVSLLQGEIGYEQLRRL